ncbi:MAG TPA: hypothetical protein VF129_06135 [Actinomycetota bacterium]
MDWYLFWRLVHFAGIVVFVAGHGVSAAVTVRLRNGRDPARLEALLGLSRSTIVWSNLGLAVLVLGGVANWIRVDYSPQGWLWAAVMLLAVLAIAGVGLAAPYFRRVRAAVGAGDEDRLASALASPLPWALFWLETAGVAVILWLMVYKPF